MKRTQQDRWLKHATERERIALILRGPALGVPMHLPATQRVCSACLRVLSFRKFTKGGHGKRIWPICDDCIDDPQSLKKLDTLKTATTVRKIRTNGGSHGKRLG